MPRDYPPMPLPGWPTEDPYLPAVRGQSPAALYRSQGASCGEQPAELHLHQHVHHAPVPESPLHRYVAPMVPVMLAAAVLIGVLAVAGPILVSMVTSVAAAVEAIAAGAGTLVVMAVAVVWMVRGMRADQARTAKASAKGQRAR